MQTVEQIKANHFIRTRAALPELTDFTGEQLVARTMAGANVMWRALAVVTRDTRIREYLEANDPQALGQALAAMDLWQDEHPALYTEDAAGIAREREVR